MVKRVGDFNCELRFPEGQAVGRGIIEWNIPEGKHRGEADMLQPWRGRKMFRPWRGKEGGLFRDEVTSRDITVAADSGGGRWGLSLYPHRP